MAKRFISGLIIAIIIAAAATGYGLFKYRNAIRWQRQNAKAPEQQLTIIEGWTNAQIAGAVADKGLMAANDFLAAEKNFDSTSYPLLNSKPKDADLEGFLFPDTYRVAKYAAESTITIADAVIKKMLDNFSAKFTPQMAAEARSRGYNVFQIVTLASIVEKETGRNAVTDAEKASLLSERKIVAGIFYNRLAAGMPLQSDATVNYVTGKNAPQASLNDIATDSPYNTYKYAGLPPGPICNPSLSSLEAALEPTQTDYLYFLTRPDTGQAVYAKTYQEHLANKRKYLGSNP